MATIKRSLSKKRALNGKSEILLRVNINHGQQVRLKSTLFINPENTMRIRIKSKRENQVVQSLWSFIS